MTFSSVEARYYSCNPDKIWLPHSDTIKLSRRTPVHSTTWLRRVSLRCPRSEGSRALTCTEISLLAHSSYRTPSSQETRESYTPRIEPRSLSRTPDFCERGNSSWGNLNALRFKTLLPKRLRASSHWYRVAIIISGTG